MKTKNKKSMDKIKVMIEEGNVMKKEVSLICVLVLVVSSFVFGAGGVLPGSGTGSDPYLIEDLADFDVFSDGVNAETYWDASVKMMCDIDLGGRVYDNAVIAPYLDNEIDSNNVVAYSGFFEGDGHVISGLVIDTEGEVAKSVGLFGKINEGEVRNLSVADVSIIAEASMYVGGLCGEFEKSYIYCCNVTGTVRGGGDVRNSYYYDQSSTGGVFGCVVYGTSDVRFCWSECNVDGAVNVGGFCGSNSGVIYACYAKGRVNNYLESETQYGITGGFCGYNIGGISDCYCVGEVQVGGSVGGKGFCCWNESGNINNCFWDVEVSGVYNSDGGYGRLTSQMKEMSTYTDYGWHFINVPEAGDGGAWVMKDYPKVYFKYFVRPYINMPSMDGDLPADAESELEQFGLSVGDIIYEYSNGIAEGRIIRTIPEGRAIVEEGAEIGLVVSKGSCPVVPNLAYKEKAEAAAAIINSGFVVGCICESYNWIYDAGEVISQKPESGSFLLPGGEVSIMVSLGNPSHLEGAGTKDDPYLMKNSGDFFRFTDKGFDDKYCAAGVYTRLECDLDLLCMEYDEAVIPEFYGVFDGNGHVIRNLKIVSEGDYLGLFGKVEGENAKVCNLGLEDVEIIFGENSEYVGALCGRLAESEISGCHSTGIIECDSFYMYDDNFESLYIGGLCGSLVGDGKVYDTFSSCDILANNSRWVGGLIGSINNGEVVHCYATGNVDGRYNAGGFVGGSFYGIGEIRYCYATGDVEGVEGVGGFCGWDEEDIHIEYCYASGDVFGGESVGGFCGYGTASNSCALGNVQGDENVGGFAGYGGGTNSCARGRVIGNQNVGSFCGIAEGDVINCYSTGELLGHGMIYSGGQLVNLVFWGKRDRSDIENCFWDVETTGVGEPGDTLGGVKGLSTAQMKTKQTFVDAGWEFRAGKVSVGDSVKYYLPDWEMVDSNYPEKLWMNAKGLLPGSGSSSDPYRIENIDQFNIFRSNLYFCEEGICTKLMCDLDLAGMEYDNSLIVPHYSESYTDYLFVYAFMGVFDGCGHVIKNIKIKNDANNIFLATGLFAKIYGENAVVKNLGVENINYSYQREEGDLPWDLTYGGICGEIEYGTIENCYTTGVIDIDYNWLGMIGMIPYGRLVGGICGINIAGKIENSFSSCNISGYGGGGLCGWNRGGEIYNCFATGDVAGNSAGGLCVASEIYNDQYSPNNPTCIPVIKNCYATGNISCTDDSDVILGGLVGSCEGELLNCYATGSIDCVVSGNVDRLDVGGLCGSNTSDVENCYATGDIDCVVTAYVYRTGVGGFIGTNSGYVSSCYSSGNVTVESQDFYVGDVGGFCGRFEEYLYNNIRQCYATGDVVGVGNVSNVGGFCGSSDDVIRLSYALGDVVGNKNVGGFVGEISYNIYDCYSAGQVTGNIEVGGLVGSVDNSYVYDSFWDIETSGVAVSAGGVGKTTAEMQDINTFLNAEWDFVGEVVNGTEDVWRMSAVGYPRFVWHVEVPDINGDLSVDLFDFAIIADAWMSNYGDDGYVSKADLDGSGEVDIADIEMFIASWLQASGSAVNLSLMGYWSFDNISINVTKDSSKFGRDGTVYGEPEIAAGMVDGCYVFDGVDDYVEIEGYAGIGGSSARTVAAWIKLDEDLGNNDNAMYSIVSWGQGIVNSYKKWMMIIDESTGKLALAIYGARLKGGPDLEDGLWHHVAIVHPEDTDNINQVKMYIDGVEVATNASSLNAVINTARTESVLIGARDIDSEFGIQTPDGFFKGAIDEVRIYNAALSDEELAELAR